MKKCIACGLPLMEEPLLDLDQMPASAQDIPDASQVLKEAGLHLRLCQCSGCGLVQFDCEPVGYYRDVIRAGGFSTTMVELRRSQYAHLIDTYHLEGKKFIEVGAGRGEFLSVLAEFPVKAAGLEHRRALAELAGESGLTVYEGFAENETTVFPDGPYDVFLSFNFLEHQPDPAGMLRAIYANLAEDGMGLITVPSFEYILDNDGFYELIRDHLAYYTFGTLQQLLEHCGFMVLDQEMVNRDTISMIVKKKPRVQLEGLNRCFLEIQQEADRILENLKSEGKRMAIWGASHQGFTLAATTGLASKIAYIIDSAPFKQGRFAPASHLPIVAPEHFLEDPVDVILIVAPGYTDEIYHIIRSRFRKSPSSQSADGVEIMVLRSNHIERME